MANPRWKTVYTTIRFTAWEIRQMADALQHVMDNPDPYVDYSALGQALDKLRNRIGDINYGRMVEEEPL